jgi:hypothetical protein
MIERPERRAHERQVVRERVTISGTNHQGLVVVHGTIINTGPGGLAVELVADADFDPEFVPDVVMTRSAGTIRHLVLRALALEGRILRAAFIDPPMVDPSEWTD